MAELEQKLHGISAEHAELSVKHRQSRVQLKEAQVKLEAASDALQQCHQDQDSSSPRGEGAKGLTGGSPQTVDVPSAGFPAVRGANAELARWLFGLNRGLLSVLQALYPEGDKMSRFLDRQRSKCPRDDDIRCQIEFRQAALRAALVNASPGNGP